MNLSKKAYLLLTLTTFLSFGQQSKRLNDNWKFLKSDIGGIWEILRPAKEGTPETVPLWTDVTLPHCFNAIDAVDPNVNYYQGPGWYTTKLKIENPYENGRTILHFEGAGQKSQVYVYDKKVGEHLGGYDEWKVDITAAIKEFSKNPEFKGVIPISIRCDNSRDLEMMPSNLSDFNVYGGIYRYLNLVYTPQVSTDKIFALATVDAKGIDGNLKISTILHNPNGIDKGIVDVKLKDPTGKIVQTFSEDIKLFYGEKLITNFKIKKPILWSVDNTNLYTVEVSISENKNTHLLTEKIGFRNFEFQKKGPFYLNGKRVLLRGTHRHEDHAGVAAAMTEEMMITEMKMMKEMGVNFIRLGHYQQSRIILDLCDSLGILVWEEIPWCRGGLGGEKYQKQGKDMLTNMIQQHYNHPSIIIWGMGNENDWPNDFSTFDKHAIREYMKELHNLSHRLDDTRPTAIRRCDFCKDIIDIYSPSIWAGWYRGIYTEYKEISKKEFDAVDRFLHVEWGGDSHARRHDENPDKALNLIKRTGAGDERSGDASLFGGSARVSKDGDWSESYICNLIDWHLKEQETMPWLSGTAYWPFKDFSTPVRPDNPVPYMNQKGVIERDFTKKESFFVFQSFWTNKLMAHIYGHSWPVRWGDKQEEKMIKVYSNADEAELFFNGKSLGTKKRDSQDFPAAGLRWSVKYEEGENKIKVVAKKGKEVVVDEITQQYQSEKWGKPAKIKLEIVSDKNNIVTVKATLLDANNLICLDNKEYMNFNLIGYGKLIDNQGTSSGSNKVQFFNGQSVISLEKNTGKSIISASTKGITTEFLEIK
jgi:beta-galactosidase